MNEIFFFNKQKINFEHSYSFIASVACFVHHHVYVHRHRTDCCGDTSRRHLGQVAAGAIFSQSPIQSSFFRETAVSQAVF